MPICLFQVLMNLYQQMTTKKVGIEQPNFIHKTVSLEKKYM